MTSLLLVVLALAAAQQPPASAGAGRAGAIHGRIVERDTGSPVPGATVRLMYAAEMKVTLADRDGYYGFSGLGPGTYNVYVENPPHRVVYLTGPFLDTDAGNRIVLAEGEKREGVDVRLARAAALSVRVVDDWGEPLADVRVNVKSATSGREIPVGFLRRTDDRGIVRLFPLAAGSYVVCADPDLGVASGKASSRPVERFVATCVSREGTSEPAPVTVSVPGPNAVDVMMSRRPAFSISGVVLDAAGSPAPGIHLNFERATANGSVGHSIVTGADGRFVVGGVAPGAYAIATQRGGPDNSDRPGPLEAAYVPIVVADSNIEDLTVALTRTVDVEGRVVFDDSSPPRSQPGMPPVMVVARFAGDLALRTGSSIRPGYLRPDSTFDLEGVFGRRVLAFANIPRGWYVKSVMYGTTDVTDVPIEFKASGPAIEVHLSARGAAIAGSVVDDAGNPVAGSRVVVYPADPARRWPMHIPSAVATRDGRFTIGPLRAGDYMAVALGKGVDHPLSWDAAHLKQLDEHAERVTLHGEETVEVQLRVR